MIRNMIMKYFSKKSFHVSTCMTLLINHIFMQSLYYISSCKLMGILDSIIRHPQYIDGLIANCSNSIANTPGLLQSATKPRYISISHHSSILNGTGSLYPSSWLTLFFIINVVATDAWRRKLSIHWSQVLSRELRCSWSSDQMRCFNCILVTNHFIVY